MLDSQRSLNAYVADQFLTVKVWEGSSGPMQGVVRGIRMDYVQMRACIAEACVGVQGCDRSIELHRVKTGGQQRPQPCSNALPQTDPHRGCCRWQRAPSAAHAAQQTAQQTAARAGDLAGLCRGAGQGDNGAGRGAGRGGQGDWQLRGSDGGGLAAGQAVAGADQCADLQMGRSREAGRGVAAVQELRLRGDAFRSHAGSMLCSVHSMLPACCQ
ncbi:hypothetical protein ABPG75_007324 [Micractinium tetrahymenae]